MAIRRGFLRGTLKGTPAGQVPTQFTVSRHRQATVAAVARRMGPCPVSSVVSVRLAPAAPREQRGKTWGPRRLITCDEQGSTPRPATKNFTANLSKGLRIWRRGLAPPWGVGILYADRRIFLRGGG